LASLREKKYKQMKIYILIPLFLILTLQINAKVTGNNTQNPIPNNVNDTLKNTDKDTSYRVRHLTDIISDKSLNADNNTLIKKANNEYKKENYNNAISLYSQVIKNGYECYGLYYNTGNSYFKIDDIPSAILYYEKAKKLNPNNDDINFNIKIANTKLIDKIEPIPELFLKQWWKKLLNLFPADIWAKITIIIFSLFFVLFTIYLLSKIITLKKISFWLAVVCFVLTIITYLFANKQYNLTNNEKTAIIFTPTLTVKSSPNNNSKDLFIIHEGMKVNIIDKVGSWYEIKIANGSIGWIEKSNAKII